MIKIREGFKGQRVLVLPRFAKEECANDLFGSQLYITDIGYFPQAEHHYCKRPEGAGEYVFIFCREGNGWIKIREKEYKLNKEQFIIIPAFEPHEYGASEKTPWTIYWVHFMGKYAKNFALGFDKPTTIFQNKSIRISDQINLFESIFEVIKNGYSKDNIKFAMANMYAFLGTMSYMSVKRDSEFRNKEDLDLAERAVKYLKDNLDRIVTTKDLCTFLDCSSSILATKFKTRIGMTPMAYLNHLRIQEACKYLDNTNMTIVQICVKVGIEDQYYFSRLFTHVMGMSPSKYRNAPKW